MLAEAPQRVDTMVARQQSAPGAKAFVPPARELRVLREAAAACLGCDLGHCATQTVFGEGPWDARVMLIGEQPGDEEDRSGRPFVGTAGKVLDDALQRVGLDRSQLYVTNAVKHFGFIERGKRRIHRTPKLMEVVACRPWLDAEIESVRPEVVVCLGATAARAVFGQQFRLTTQRGTLLESSVSPRTLATYHPSAVLRAADPATGDLLFQALVHDLAVAAAVLQETVSERG